MEGRTVLITGATSGIGKAAVTGLAERGATVLAVARDPARGAAALADIRRRVPAARLELLTADLADLDAVRALAAEVIARYDRLDVLINNAGVATFRPEQAPAMFTTNHLAPFLLTNLLLPLLQRSAPARVITVGSGTWGQNGKIPWDDLAGGMTYPMTKAFNILFTYELARRVAGTGVTANCAGPGFVRTNLGRHATGGFGLFLKLAKPIQLTPEQGATTLVYLASSPEVAEVSGRTFVKCKPVTTGELTRDPETARRLWDISSELVGSPGRLV
jgi:retinol dehydrogenase-12